MTGILDRKERVLDFILTEEGYKQMQTGDIRFTYATFSDKDTIYHHDKDNNFISGNLNFRFQASSNFYDTISPEIDLNRGADYNISLNNITVLDELNNLNNNTQTFLTASAAISSHMADMLKNHRLLTTTSSLDKNELSLKSSSNEDPFFDYKVEENSPETTVKESVNIRNLDLIKNDARFYDKLNFLFLPPTNKDGSQLGKYISRQQSPDRVLVKKGIPGFDNNFYQNSLKEIEKNQNIPRKEFFIDQVRKDSNYIFQVYEKNIADETINKLVVIDHGDVSFIEAENKSTFKRIFSVGKLYQVEKNDVDLTLKESDKQIKIRSFFSFVNLFTVSFEENL
tara:strand:- start:10765 stop:11784 length:1020 start_codon:yes stop_codon:yes gene_type:complete